MARTDTEPRTARGMRTALPWMPVEVRRRGEVVSACFVSGCDRWMTREPALEQVERARKPRASVATTRGTRVPRRGRGIRATPSPVEIEPPASSPRAPASADGTIGRSLADERAFRGRKASKTVKRMRTVTRGPGERDGMLTRATRGDAGGQSHAGDAGDSSHLEDGCVCVYARLGARGTGKTDRKQTSRQRGFGRGAASSVLIRPRDFEWQRHSRRTNSRRFWNFSNQQRAIFRETALLLAFFFWRRRRREKLETMMFRNQKKNPNGTTFATPLLRAPRTPARDRTGT